MKLNRTSEAICNNNNNSDAQKTVKLTIGEELWKLLTNLIEWKPPPGKKIRDSISPVDLHTIVCKIKPRYKLVFYYKLYLKLNNFFIICTICGKKNVWFQIYKYIYCYT